jgi:hypothetical protein
MDSAWVHEIAMRDMSLEGTALASAIAYAEAERWLADSRTRNDWIYLTRLGQLVAKGQVMAPLILFSVRRCVSASCRRASAGISVQYALHWP